MIEPTDGPTTGMGTTGGAGYGADVGGTPVGGSGAVESGAGLGSSGGSSGSSGSSTTDVAKDQAAQAKETAKAEAGQVAQQAKQQAATLAQEAKGHAASLLHDARSEAETHANTQAQRAAGGMRDLGRQLRSMSESGEQGQLTNFVRQAADQVEEFAERLDDQGVAGLVDDVQRFARRKPGLFLVGAGLAGFAAGRLLRNVDMQAIKPGGDTSGYDTGGYDQLTTSGQADLLATTPGSYTPGVGASGYDVATGTGVGTGPVLDEPLIGGEGGVGYQGGSGQVGR